MPKFKYVGKDEHTLAQVGLIKPDQVFEVSTQLGAALLKHAPDSYELQPDKGEAKTDPKPVETKK